MRSVNAVDWMTPEELLEEGFRRSRVVMINEAHDGMLRCIRTREIGLRLLPTAHQLGVRALAMEAFGAPGLDYPRDRGYLGQPEMATFIGQAQALGWTVFGYEADHRAVPQEIGDDVMSQAFIWWREQEQAQNLWRLVTNLGENALVVVWGGWGHVLKAKPMMAGHFAAISGIDPFVIDQTLTVLTQYDTRSQQSLIKWARPKLDELDGTAGFVVEPEIIDLPPGRDAVLLSLANSME